MPCEIKVQRNLSQTKNILSSLHECTQSISYYNIYFHRIIRKYFKGKNFQQNKKMKSTSMIDCISPQEDAWRLHEPSIPNKDSRLCKNFHENTRIEMGYTCRSWWYFLFNHDNYVSFLSLIEFISLYHLGNCPFSLVKLWSNSQTTFTLTMFHHLKFIA